MNYQLLQGDCIEVLKTLPAASVHCVVTSPPYYSLRDYQVKGQIGLEPTPSEYVAKLVEVFRQVWRVLRDDGTVFLNLGDSYFGSNQTGGTNSKEGSAKRMGRMFTRPSGVRHAAAYDTSGKAPEGYRVSDCLCGNLCDVCRVVYRSHKFRNDSLLVAMLTASLSAPSRAHMESGFAHLPTSDLLHQASRNAGAIQDRPQIVPLFGERLRAALVSTIGESYPQLLGVCLQRADSSECLLCGRSLSDCAPVCAHTSDVSQGQWQHNQGNALHDGQQVHHSLCTDTVCECCTESGSYPYYTTPYHSTQLKPKDLIGIPWRVAFALQADGWWLRSDIIWAKPNPMPESVTDRPTKAHEYLFLLAKSERYFYDSEAIKEPAQFREGQAATFERTGAVSQHVLPGQTAAQHRQNRGKAGKNAFRGAGRERQGAKGPANREGRELTNVGYGQTRNKRSVWTVATRPYKEAHFATYPVELIQPCIKAGTSAHGCCSVCGAPWVRVVEREVLPPPDRINNNGFEHDAMTTHGEGAATLRNIVVKDTTGWQSSCGCGADVVPCTVLDPFNGSGTTGVAAIGLGRQYIGIELNPEYIKLAERRLNNTQPTLIEID